MRKQKTDREDARLLLKLLQEDRFPRVWVPNPENRDLVSCCGIDIRWCK